MPTYVVLVKWTEQGRREVAGVADRFEENRQRAEQLGVRPIASVVTMGRYDQVVVAEAPDDEAIARVVLGVTGTGNAVTETLRGFTMEEVQRML